MANIIGIDLGTSTTLMARLNEAGQAEILRNDEGDNLTPSAVWFETADKAVVGKEAKRMLGIVDGSRIFVEYKRDMHDDSIAHMVDGKKWTPRDFSALVLKKLRVQLDATGMQPDAVIITIPANFMDEARVNTLLAAKDAGFDLKDDALINEPTAAALYYVTRSTQPIQGRCLVYDFGGGTFDATILEVKGNDIQVKTSVGVQHLGGKDIDEKLMGLVADKFSKTTGASFDAKELGITKWDIEQNYKHPLSIRDKINVVIRSPEHGPVRFDITRAEFEEAISSLIAQANMAVESALDRACLKTSDIDHVFLAGGATRVAAVASSVEKLIGKKPFSDNPDEAVAKGAAIYAGIRNKDKMGSGQRVALGDKKVTDVTPHYYGTVAWSPRRNTSYNDIIIHKDRPAPCSESKTFYRSSGQTQLRIRITESPADTDDIDFVTVSLDEQWKDLPDVSTDSEIKVTYTYDTNGMVSCRFVDVISGKIFERDLARGVSSGKADKTKGADSANIDDILL